MDRAALAAQIKANREEADRPILERARAFAEAVAGSDFMNGLAALPYRVAGAPVDLADTVTRPIAGLFGVEMPKPVGGSDWMIEQATRAGVKNPMRGTTAEMAGEVVGGLLDPTPSLEARIVGGAMGDAPQVARIMDSTGRPVHHTDEGVENFNRWFEGSQMTDSQGRPMVFYHGTKGNFSSFSPEKIGQSDHGSVGRGYYFSEDPNTANVYATFSHGDNAPTIMPVYLSLKNPADYDALPNMGTEERSAAVTKNLISLGHDGIIKRGADGVMDEVVVFSPEQIKSATGNSGAYSPNTRDITGSIDPRLAGLLALGAIGAGGAYTYNQRQEAKE